jgi:hypothetical protein
MKMQLSSHHEHQNGTPTQNRACVGNGTFELRYGTAELIAMEKRQSARALLPSQIHKS